MLAGKAFNPRVPCINMHNHMQCRVPRMALPDSLDATSGGGLYSGVAGAGGPASPDSGPKGISSAPKPGQDLEFGAVAQQNVGDAIALRRRLAGGV